MKITVVEALPCSFPTPPEARVNLGLGTAVKRDAVLVKVATDEGIVGWGESHHGRAPTAVAQLINTTLREALLGQDPLDTVGVWEQIYRIQLATHGLGAGAAIAMSGIDIALWDIRGKASGWPLFRLLGGGQRDIPTYAGGIALGYGPESALADEASSLVDKGFRAVKIRLGQGPSADAARLLALRSRLGDGVDILSDANASYSLDEARAVMPVLEETRVRWLEEPFPAHDHRSYAALARTSRVPLAAGENHYTRFEFNRLIEDRSIEVLQPDLSKTGGITEAVRIAALASAWKLLIHPHTSTTGINMAATVHFLAAIGNGGFFESDVSVANPFRDQLVDSTCYTVAPETGTVRPSDEPGLGITVDEQRIEEFPVIEGAGYR